MKLFAMFISLLISYVKHSLMHDDMVLVGSECSVRWAWEESTETRFISFAPEPVDNSDFDDFGWSMDSVSAHVPNLRGLMSFMRSGAQQGHEFQNVSLIYAYVAD